MVVGGGQRGNSRPVGQIALTRQPSGQPIGGGMHGGTINADNALREHCR